MTSETIDLDESADQRRGAFAVISALGSLLALGSLFLVRAAVSQQHQLFRAGSESNRLRDAYQRVIENLPTGLYQFRGGRCVFSNPPFERQVNRTDGHSLTDAFRRSLHPDDAADVFATLEKSEASKTPFHLRFRTIGDGGETSYIESRGVPVFDQRGNLSHLLGFTVDVSETVSAHLQLRSKHVEVESANQLLRNAITELQDNYEAMVHSWVKAVEAKDPYTAGHSERVRGYSVRMGQELGLDADQLRVLHMGTLIHDVGKIGIPDAILLSPSGLADEEFEVIKQHTIVGVELIQGIPAFHECIPIVRWHHEKLDGSGYPDGLKGEEIPLLVRVVTVADMFDAITSQRAYRDAMRLDRALSELTEEATKGKIDQKIVAVLAEIVNRDGVLSPTAELKAA